MTEWPAFFLSASQASACSFVASRRVSHPPAAIVVGPFGYGTGFGGSFTHTPAYRTAPSHGYAVSDCGRKPTRASSTAFNFNSAGGRPWTTCHSSLSGLLAP